MYEETQITRKIIVMSKEESQSNDRGVGPGAAASVTSYILKKGAKPQPGQQTTAVQAKVQSVKQGLPGRKSNAASQPPRPSLSKGRLALARQGSRVS